MLSGHKQIGWNQSLQLRSIDACRGKFYRVDRSRARSSGGSEIGLPIARHLAWAMGGELTASSEGIRQGSTFCFTLPLAE